MRVSLESDIDVTKEPVLQLVHVGNYQYELLAVSIGSVAWLSSPSTDLSKIGSMQVHLLTCHTCSALPNPGDSSRRPLYGNGYLHRLSEAKQG